MPFRNRWAAVEHPATSGEVRADVQGNTRVILLWFNSPQIREPKAVCPQLFCWPGVGSEMNLIRNLLLIVTGARCCLWHTEFPFYVFPFPPGWFFFFLSLLCFLFNNCIFMFSNFTGQEYFKIPVWNRLVYNTWKLPIKILDGIFQAFRSLHNLSLIITDSTQNWSQFSSSSLPSLPISILTAVI